MKTFDEPIGAPSPESATVAPGASRRLVWIVALLIVCCGAAVRIYPSGRYRDAGFDEKIYRDNALLIERDGIGSYPRFCASYIQDQRRPEATAKLPPTRFLYVFCGYLVRQIAYRNAAPLDRVSPSTLPSDPVHRALKTVSVAASILMMIVAGAAAWRLLGYRIGLVALALTAASPVQIHLSQHAFVDGFLAMWATLCLWLLWENLRAPNHTGWLAAYGVSLMCMVLTKENAFFVFLGLGGLVALNRCARFGVVTPRLWLVMVLGPIFGLAALMTLAGGVGPFIDVYHSLVLKAENLAFAIATGDGPWYRYLIELLTVSPIVFVLAVSGLVSLPRENRTHLYLLGFVVFSYVIMCNVPYGMNLRYTTIWELPLSVFAATQLLKCAAFFGRRGAWMAVLLTMGVCTYNLRQYHIFFVEHPIYEFVPEGMLRAVNVVKDLAVPKPQDR
jgi:Dolichyl-phosphate-mannose-protein mannosyltransferase